MVTTALIELFRWSALLIPPLGFLLNFLLIWLILRRTPKEMRVHSRILLQTCLMDCLFLAVLTIGAPAFITISDQVVLCFNGYFAKLLAPLYGPFGIRCHYLMNTFFFYFDVFSACIQFICRFLVLVRNSKVSLRLYLLLLTVAVVADLLLIVQSWHFTPAVSIVPAPNGLAEWADQAFLFLPEGNIEFGLLWRIFLASPIAFYLLCYSTMAFCAWKMVRFLSSHAEFNAQLKALNRQMTLNLIILAFLPLLTSALDISITAPYFNLPTFSQNMTLLDNEIDNLEFLAAISIFWLPLLNPVVSILTNTPYRHTVFGMLCMKTRVGVTSDS